MSNNNNNNNKRKRVRISHSCVQCKRRKIKCNRGKPVCSACYKSNIVDCHYTQPDWSRLLSPSNSIEVDNNNNNSNNNNNNNNSDVSPIGSTSSIKTDDDAMRNEIELMKMMIMNLEDKIKKSNINFTENNNNNNDNDNDNDNNGAISTSYNEDFPTIDEVSEAFFNEKLDVWKPSVLFHKDTRSLYFGSSSVRTDLILDDSASKISRFIMKSIRKERKNYKKDSTKSFNSLDNDSINFTCNYDEISFNHYSSIISDIIKARIPKIDILFELVKYFEDNLVQFFPFIEMPIVWSYFNQHFKVDPTDNSLIFVKPEKSSFYSPIAIIFGISTLSLLFSKEDEFTNFKYLPGESQGNNKISSVFLKCLKISRFMKKQSIPALQSLLLLRSIQIYDISISDGGDETNSYGYFQAVISMAFSIGLHRNPNKLPILTRVDGETPYKYMSEVTWRKTWNYILRMDITYSATIGTPLMVRDDMYDCFCDLNPNENDYLTLTTLEKGYKILKKISYNLFTKISNISLNELINLLNDLLKFMAYDIETFESLLIDNERNSRRLNDILKLLTLKLECLYHVISLSTLLKLITKLDPIVYNSKRPNPLTELEISILQKMSKYYEFETVKSSIFAFFIIEKISNVESCLKSNQNYIVFLIPKIRKLLLRCFFSILIQVFRLNNHSSLDDNSIRISNISNPKNILNISSFDYNLEYSMYDKFMKYPKSTKIHVQLLKNSICRDFIAYLCEVLIKSMSHTPVFGKDYAFFVGQRSLLVVCWYAEARQQKRIKIGNDFANSIQKSNNKSFLFKDATLFVSNTIRREGEASPRDFDKYLDNNNVKVKDSSIFSEATKFVSNSIKNEVKASPQDFGKYFDNNTNINNDNTDDKTIDNNDDNDKNNENDDNNDNNDNNDDNDGITRTRLGKVSYDHKYVKAITPYDALGSVTIRSCGRALLSNGNGSGSVSGSSDLNDDISMIGITPDDESFDKFLDLNDKSQEFYNWLVNDFDSDEFSKYISSVFSPSSI